MTVITQGVRVAFGIRPEYLTAKITNLPPDTLKVRIRIRETETARAFVKTPNEITQWILAPDGADLKLLYPEGTNSEIRIA